MPCLPGNLKRELWDSLGAPWNYLKVAFDRPDTKLIPFTPHPLPPDSVSDDVEYQGYCLQPDVETYLKARKTSTAIIHLLVITSSVVDPIYNPESANAPKNKDPKQGQIKEEDEEHDGGDGALRQRIILAAFKFAELHPSVTCIAKPLYNFTRWPHLVYFPDSLCPWDHVYRYLDDEGTMMDFGAGGFGPLEEARFTRLGGGWESW